MGKDANIDDFLKRLDAAAAQADAQALQAEASVGEAPSLEPFLDMRSFREVLRDAKAEMTAERQAAREAKEQRRAQEKAAAQERRAQKEAAAQERRRNFIYDDTVRKWREDANDYLTDYEYVDWYEGYYYDPDNPY